MNNLSREKLIVAISKLVISIFIGIIAGIFLDFFRINLDYFRREYFITFIGIVTISYFSLSMILEKQRLINKQSIIISTIALILGIILSYKFEIIGNSYFYRKEYDFLQVAGITGISYIGIFILTKALFLLISCSRVMDLDKSIINTLVEESALSKNEVKCPNCLSNQYTNDNNNATCLKCFHNFEIS